MTVKLGQIEQTVFRAFAGTEGYEGFGYLSFAAVARESGVDRKHIRRAVRSLARKGLLVFGKGLWSYDGQPGGSGYALTKRGAAEMVRHDGEKGVER